jgi:hypothetical protein
MGPDIKNNCAGEDQQQFTAVLFTPIFPRLCRKQEHLITLGRMTGPTPKTGKCSFDCLACLLRGQIHDVHTLINNEQGMCYSFLDVLLTVYCDIGKESITFRNYAGHFDSNNFFS